MTERSQPILVGFGQITQKLEDVRESLEPIDLMAEAARRAERDTRGESILHRADTVGVVNLVSWDYGDPPGVLSERLGIEPSRRVHTAIGGNGPQLLLHSLADSVARGETRLALVAGGEAMYSRRRARRAGIDLTWTPPTGAPDESLGDSRWGTSDIEMRHGAAMPVAIYPMFENALRASRRWTLEDHRARVGGLFSRFTEIAANNPYAWFRQARTAGELIGVTQDNRMIGFPYPKLLNAIMDVDQAAATILTSVEVARQLGIPEDRWVYLHGAADATDHWFVLDRTDYAASPAIRAAGRVALEQAGIGIDDVGVFDLYSCFPSAVQIAREMLGIPEEDLRDLTVTGGLPYFGGPGNAYGLHSIAAMGERLRSNPETYGLVTTVGWYLTKHAVGVYSTTPPKQPWKRRAAEALQEEIDRQRGPEAVSEPDGIATVETYTVLHDREGEPVRAIVIGRLGDGRRFIANTPSDVELFRSMESEEFCGRKGRVRHGNGLNVWEPS